MLGPKHGFFWENHRDKFSMCIKMHYNDHKFQSFVAKYIDKDCRPSIVLRNFLEPAKTNWCKIRFACIWMKEYTIGKKDPTGIN